jgi:hypothetical protein
MQVMTETLQRLSEQEDKGGESSVRVSEEGKQGLCWWGW